MSSNREPKTLIRYVVYGFGSIVNPAKLLPRIEPCHYFSIPYYGDGYGWSEAAQDSATVVPKVRSRLDHRTRCDVLAVDAGAWLRIWRIPPIKTPVAGSVFFVI